MSFTSFLTDTQLLLVVAAVAFAAGVVLSQKVKDTLTGVPSDVRAALKSAESNTLAAVSQARTDALAKLLPTAVKTAPAVAVAPAAPPAPPAAPVAPAAPAVESAAPAAPAAPAA